MYLSIMEHYDVVIIGAGLSGLTAALHLGRTHHKILVVEKQGFPHHKVCGEYVSNEVLPYLGSLGVDLTKLGATAIHTLQLTTPAKESLTIELPLGGFGISRYTFDHSLYQKALSLGVQFKFQTVVSVNFAADVFTIKTLENEVITAKFTIGSFGKRSNLDKFLNRGFMGNKSPWLAVKQHYEHHSFPDHLVALHNFKGGYGGLSKTETGAVNFCYLVHYKSFQAEKSIAEFNRKVVRKNPYLDEFLSQAQPIFREPLSIAQITFGPKEMVKEHLLLCGDSAGMIHPLCGNGMAMAIHSAKIASELIHDFLITESGDRSQLEQRYTQEWARLFAKRLWMGRRLQSVLLNENLSGLGMSIATKSPKLIRKLIQYTHGKPIA